MKNVEVTRQNNPYQVLGVYTVENGTERMLFQMNTMQARDFAEAIDGVVRAMSL